MPRLVAVLLAGLLAGIAATWLVMRGGEPPPRETVVRDLVVTESVTIEAAEQHRADSYRTLTTIAEVLALPRPFDRNEALYALAGRSDAAETQSLIFEANRIADPGSRAASLGILFARLTDLDAPSALALVRTEYFRSDRSLEDGVWASWARADLDDALFSASTQPNERLRVAAAQSLYRAFGDQGNATTDRIEEELGIPPDLETRSRYVLWLADRSVPEAIDYLNSLPTSFDRLDLTLRLANYLSVVNPQAALVNLDRIADGTHRNRVKNIVESAVARRDPLGTIERVLAKGDSPNRSSEFSHAIISLAVNDMDQAIALFAGTSNPEAKRAIGSSIATIMAGKDPDAALAWVRANRQPMGGQYPYQSLELSVLNSIAREDPARAVLEAQALAEPNQRGTLLSALFDNMNYREPRDMLGLLELIEDEAVTRDVEVRAAMNWSQRDPEAALEYIMSRGEERATEILAQTGWYALAQDVNLAMRVMPRLPPDAQRQARQQIAQRLAQTRSPEEAQAFIRQFANESDYAELQSSLISGIARSDPMRAAQMADQVVDQNARDTAYMTIVMQQARTDPQQASALVDRITNESMRQQATSSVVQFWARRDIETAIQWARGQPAGPARDDALMHLARNWPNADQRALDIAASIQDEQMRGQAQISLVFQMANGDQNRMREMLSRLDLPDNLRQQTEQWMQQYRGTTID